MAGAASTTTWRIALALLTKSTLRHWWMAKWSYLLIIAIVALGVGSLNGIRQASRAATANFGLFNEAISGRSDFLIKAPAGPIREATLPQLAPLTRQPDWHLLPVIEGPFTQLSASGEPVRLLRLIGLDLVSVANLPTFIDREFEFGSESSGWSDWVGARPRVWLSRTLAESAGLAPGDSLRGAVGGRLHELEVFGLLGDGDNPVPEDLLIADLPAAQGILARAGEIDRIEAVVDNREARKSPDAMAAMAARVRALLPDGFVLRAAAERVAERADMTAAFRLNLTILSLIAILVGAYLILQALDTAVVRRRAELATLKSLGVGERTLFLTLMLESLLIGGLGSILGLGVGMVLAAGAVHLLADTVNALYFATSVEAIRLGAGDVFTGMAVGIGFSLFAGLLPARDAMFTPPAQILSRGDWSPGFVWLRRPWTGLVLVGMGLLFLLVPPLPLAGGSQMPLGGFLAAGCGIVGAALLSGQALVWIARGLKPLARGAATKLALSRLADGSSRHRLAVAGLVVAVAMVTGMVQMVGSFRGSIERWFDVRFQAELYVSERTAGGASGINGIAPEVLQAVVEDPAVAFADTLYTSPVGAPQGRTYLGGIDFEAWSDRVAQIWIKDPGSISPIAGAEPAYISETFARRFDALDGGIVALQTPTGERQITPIGIYADYGNEFGSAVIATEVWKEWIQADRPINTSLYLHPGADINTVRDSLRLQFPGLEIRNAQELRTLALGIFEQTFRVTSALNGIGLTVAVIGLALGLFSLFAESKSTWATLRRIGFPGRSFTVTAGVEGAGIAFAAWLSGTVVGLCLGWLLIYVINVQSFGWTLVWHLPGTAFLGFGGSLVAFGFLAGALTGTWHRRRLA